MRTFKYTKEPKKDSISDERVKRYKDFATLSHSYTRLTKKPKKPLYRDPKLFLFLLLIGLIALLLFQ